MNVVDVRDRAGWSSLLAPIRPSVRTLWQTLSSSTIPLRSRGQATLILQHAAMLVATIKGRYLMKTVGDS
jgi:hypothetical protein